MTGFVIVTAIIAVAIWAVIHITAWIEEGNAEIERAFLLCLDQQAADHAEPSREQVEESYGPRALWGPISDTPIYDATTAHIARHAAADIDRDWADMQRRIGGSS